MCIRLVVFATTLLLVTGRPALGCTCVPLPTGVTAASDVAAWRAEHIDAIFAGKVVSIKLNWKLLDAKIGDLVPADLEHENPTLDVQIDVSKSYRGNQQARVKLKTGLGGGDCGFGFQIDKEYLVYASKDETGALATSICTGTDLLEDSGANLAYLRGEDPETVQAKSRSPNGTICGQLILPQTVNTEDSQVLLLRDGDGSPVPVESADPAEDGSFCIEEIPIGKYVLLFVHGAVDAPSTFAYYPGVVNRTNATTIELSATRLHPSLKFDVPHQQTYSVSGTVSSAENSGLLSESKVMLFSMSQPSLALAYGQDVAENGSFTFSQVLPGEYWAIVSVDGNGTWWTRKVKVTVAGNVGNLALQLVSK